MLCRLFVPAHNMRDLVSQRRSYQGCLKHLRERERERFISLICRLCCGVYDAICGCVEGRGENVIMINMQTERLGRPQAVESGGVTAQSVPA